MGHQNIKPEWNSSTLETESLVLEIIRCLESKSTIWRNGNNNSCNTTCNLCSVFSHAQHNRFECCSAHQHFYLSTAVRWRVEKMKRQIFRENLKFLIFISLFFLIVFLTKLYWHFLEPKLANKYNEMLKRTIEFQIQYSSQNVCDQETDVPLLQVTTDKSMRSKEIRGDATPSGGTRAAATKLASVNEMLLKKWHFTFAWRVRGVLLSPNMWLWLF